MEKWSNAWWVAFENEVAAASQPLRTVTVERIMAETIGDDVRHDYGTFDARICYCDTRICTCHDDDVQTGIVMHVKPLVWCSCGAILPHHTDDCAIDMRDRMPF